MIQRNVIYCIISFSCYILFSCSKNNSVSPTYNPPAPVVGKTYSADEITAFKQMTLNATNNIITKLPAHVSVYLVDTTFPYLTRELDAIISEINKLLDTNLVINRTTNRATSTIQVYLTDRDTYIKEEPSTTSALQNSDYTGYAHFDWNSDGVIYHGSAFIDMKRTLGDTLQQRYIIHHEMMHTLGFLGHVSLTQFYTVLFYYTLTPYILDYTPFDKKMMLLLYNPAIQPGMNEVEFDSTVKNL